MTIVPVVEAENPTDFDPFDDLSPAEIEAIIELASRQIEALNLYEPLPFQEQFHACDAKERIVRGSNRAGKTLVTCVEVARALTGQDPYHKYPEKDGRCVFVCSNEDAIGQVIFRKLFRPGAFKIIKDSLTNKWRPYRPNDPADKARVSEIRLAPPLVPERMITTISWVVKSEGIPSMIKLSNGWEISFYSSHASPPAGTDLDLVVFDEEIEVEAWYGEMAARLVDRGGKFVWGATPQAGTMRLYALHERAEDDQKYCLPGQKRKIVEFKCLMADNPYMSEQDKRDFEAMVPEEEKLYRVHGDFIITTYRVYDEWEPLVHLIDPFVIPADWTHYLSVDPGFQVCAVLFAAVPQPDHPRFSDQVIFYDELYIRQCNAWLFGETLAPKVVGRFFQAFVIDMRGGRITDIGSGKPPWLQYASELEARGIRSAQTGSNFLKSSDNKEAGVMAFKGWLEPRGGKPKVQVFTTMAKFQDEIKNYHNAKKKGELVDKPLERNNHLMDNARYLAMHGCPYVAPPAGFLTRGSAAYQAFLKSLKKDRNKGRQGGGITLG